MPNSTSIATDGRRAIGQLEFIALLALLMSLAALAIDLMLPALGAIRSDFGLAPDSTAVAGLVTSYFLGLSVSQIGYGILSDRYGRKPLIYVGLGIYLLGAAASALAPSLGFLLAARFVWGIGAAGPRVLTLSIVRDTHDGAEMARVMSFIFGVFILIPVVAPSIGAFLTEWISWRGAFGFTLVAAILVGVWSLRMPETLHEENRRHIQLKSVIAAGKTVMTSPVTVFATLSLTVLFGVFLSYVASSEAIFTEVFDRGAQFPVIFGAIAMVMAVGLFGNGWLVRRFGMNGLINVMLLGYLVASSSLAVIALTTEGRPRFWVFVVALAVLALFQSFMIPNLNTIAMGPMASVAGIASAVIGTVSTGLAAVIGAFFDQAFDGTVLPLSLGFAGAGWLTVLFVNLGRARGPAPPQPLIAALDARLPEPALAMDTEEIPVVSADDDLTP